MCPPLGNIIFSSAVSLTPVKSISPVVVIVPLEIVPILDKLITPLALETFTFPLECCIWNWSGVPVALELPDFKIIPVSLVCTSIPLLLSAVIAPEDIVPTVIFGVPDNPPAVPDVFPLLVIYPAPFVNWLLFVGIVGVLVKLL